MTSPLRLLRPPLLFLGLLLLLAIPQSSNAAAQPLSERVARFTPRQICGGTGTQGSGALYQICMPFIPDIFCNHDLVIYAHGYVSEFEPLTIPAEASTLGNTLNLLGYGFATTSFSANGLAVLPAMDDLLDLVDVFTAEKGTPDTIYLVGPSQGSLITKLLIEQHADVFDGGLAICGPIGDFRAQIDYIGDFRVAFDYFFPGLLPGSPTSVPQSLIDGWDTHYAAVIEPVITDGANAGLVDQLLAVTGAATDPKDAATRTATIASLLWYNVFATNDGATVLGGQPFDNTTRVYAGSDDDVALNAGIQRFAADSAALAAIAADYETTGILPLPLVTTHTDGDELIPLWHVPLYEAKILASQSDAYHDHTTISAYGHCNYTDSQLLDAFNTLVSLVANPPPTSTPYPSVSPTPSPTETSAGPTATFTNTPSATPSATFTQTPTPTPITTAEFDIFLPAVIEQP